MVDMSWSMVYLLLQWRECSLKNEWWACPFTGWNYQGLGCPSLKQLSTWESECILSHASFLPQICYCLWSEASWGHRPFIQVCADLKTLPPIGTSFTYFIINVMCNPISLQNCFWLQMVTSHQTWYRPLFYLTSDVSLQDKEYGSKEGEFCIQLWSYCCNGNTWTLKFRTEKDWT